MTPFFLSAITLVSLSWDLQNAPKQYKQTRCTEAELGPLWTTDIPAESYEKRYSEWLLKKRRIIRFVHIHKGGGSTIVKIAKKNKEIIGPYNGNIDPDLIPGSCWVWPDCKSQGINSTSMHPALVPTIKLLRGSVEEQCAWMSGTRLTFIADEGGSPKHRFKQQGLKIFTMLRDPLDRFVSQYYHEQRGALGRQLDFPKSAVEFASYLPQQQNFILRSLLKSDAAINTDKITEEDLDAAKKLLTKEFDFVLLLENFEKTGRIILTKEFGWKVDQGIRRGSHRQSNATEELTPDEVLQLRSLNRLDIELYNFAKDLYANQLTRYLI
eukprot:m.119160 g.119160  ORF g.119160 m.119160 type:complete len:325 (+) comp14306_c0_seq5:114-1088(+)